MRECQQASATVEEFGGSVEGKVGTRYHVTFCFGPVKLASDKIADQPHGGRGARTSRLVVVQTTTIDSGILPYSPGCYSAVTQYAD